MNQLSLRPLFSCAAILLSNVFYAYTSNEVTNEVIVEQDTLATSVPLDSASLAKADFNLALDYLNRGKYQDAAIHFYSARDYWERKDSLWNVADVNYYLGIVYFDQREWALARLAMRSYLNNVRALGDSSNLPSAFVQLGYLELESGEVDMARFYAERALEILQGDEEQQNLQPYAHVLLGEIGVVSEEFEEAKNHLDQAFNSASGLGDEIAMVYSYVGYSHLKNKMDDVDGAAEQLDSALAILNSNGNISALRYTLKAGENIALAQGDWKEALFYADSLKAMNELVSNDEQVVALLNYIENEKLATENYRAQLEKAKATTNKYNRYLIVGLALVVVLIGIWLLQIRMTRKLQRENKSLEELGTEG